MLLGLFEVVFDFEVGDRVLFELLVSGEVHGEARMVDVGVLADMEDVVAFFELIAFEAIAVFIHGVIGSEVVWIDFDFDVLAFAWL